MIETEAQTDVANVTSPRPSVPQRGNPIRAVSAILASAPENSFLHRLAQACAGARRFTVEDRNAVYGDLVHSEVSGGEPLDLRDE